MSTHPRHLTGGVKRDVDHRLVWVGVGVATLIAAALRFPFLGHASLWFDEIFTRDIVGGHSLVAVWNHVRTTESTPPLYYVLAWLLDGRSEVGLRLIPALSLTAAVPVSFLAFRRLIGQWAALAASAIVAVAPILVWYAMDARAYGLLVLTSLLSVWGFGAVLERPELRMYALWAGASVACVWTHYFGGFVVLAEVLVLVWARPDARRETLLWTAAIALCLLPLAPLVAHQSNDVRNAYIGGNALTGRVTQMARQFAMGPNVPRAWLEVSGLALACIGVGVGIVLALRSGPGPRILLALAAIALGVPLVLAVTGIEDRFDVRNVIAVVPFAAALAAPALLRLRAAPLAAYLALAALTSVWVATDWRYEQPDWRSALARAEAIDRRAAVVAVTLYGGFVVRTYLGRKHATRVVRSTTVWVVVEPARAAGRRDLGPARVPPAVTAGLGGFIEVRSTIVHGFRLILLKAPRPLPIRPIRRVSVVFPPV